VSGGFVPGNIKPYIPRYFGALWFAGFVTGSRPPVLFHRADGRTSPVCTSGSEILRL